MTGVFKRSRYWARLLQALWLKYRQILILGLFIGSTVFLVLPRSLKYLTQKKVSKIGLVGRFTIDALPLSIQNLVSDGLTSVSSEGQVIPKLAASWQTENEGKNYIFVLKDNLSWQDGRAVQAKDINYNFSDVKTSFLDNKTLKFELKEPFSPFPTVVSHPVFRKGYLGTGEYQIKQVKKSGQVIEKLVLSPVKNKNKPILIYSFYPTEEAARMAFKLGEVNILEDIGVVGDLKGWKNLKITPFPKYDRLVALFFNTQDEKLADKSVRQALAYAIDKRWQPRALGPINQDSWAYNPSVKHYDLDLENAKKLLERGSEVGEPPPKPPTEIELATIPSLLEEAEEIKNDWEKLGITTKIKIINSLEENFQALLIIQEIPQDPDQYVLWHSTQKLNISRYKSPKIDKLLEDGRRTDDQQKRKEIYYDFQRFLIEDTPAVFLFYPTLYTASRI